MLGLESLEGEFVIRDNDEIISLSRVRDMPPSFDHLIKFEPKIPAGLLKMDNVTLFPHLGTASLEVRTELGMMALANIANFLEGKSPPNLV